MNVSRRRSLAFMVTTGLVAVNTLLVGLYSVLDYTAEKRQMQERLDALCRLQIHEIRVALEVPVWNIDHAQIEKVIEAMALPRSVYGLRVAAAGKTFGRQRDASWKLAPWSGRDVPRGLLVYDTPIDYAGSRVGHAWLFVSNRYVEEDLRALRMRLMGTVVLVDLILVLAAYLLISRLVLRPIRWIERFAQDVSLGGQPPRAGPDAEARELASLRSSIEKMVHELDARHVELQDEMARRSESEDRFVSIFDSVNDAIMLRDPKTAQILEANERASEMFGYTREEMLALPVGALSAGRGPYTSGTALSVIRSATRESRLFEWEVLHRDGHSFWVEINMRLAEIGGESRVVLVARDITSRRQMEEALRLSEQMSAIGALVAGVAHEVRNPLFGISATLDAFEAEFGTNADTAEYLSTLRRDVARLTRLMNDLLDYGGSRETVRHVQSARPVIEEAIRVCTPRAKERGVELEPSMPGPLPPVLIDGDRILQVLKNVVENAIEFSAGGGRVSIEARAENDGSQVVFSVSDQGPGFREEDLPHVFEPFFTRRRGGNGLGLAIVQKIVSEHGGQVAAENGPEGGAQVLIRLQAAS
jgi:PAS domain S-box-containing protein